MKKKYAIVDLETTGGMARRDKITEIGIVLYDGEKIIDQFDTLINPERSIPPEITRITGITSEMVRDAPKFYEVAKKVVEMTDQAIFVAHNVRFDYSFLKEEFKSLGFTFTKRQLCTVRLTRQAFPGLRSYSLGNLITHFDIDVKARHRALDDALATTELLGIILHQDYAEEQINGLINAGVKESMLPAGVNMDMLHNLPETSGVYYFYNSYQKVVYVGKSINIKKRVMQHFSKTTQKAERLSKMVAQITYEETGNELVAMLLESFEIKALQPEINKSQRTKDYPYFIHYFKDKEGYIQFEVVKSSVKSRKGKEILSHYGTKAGARTYLNSMMREMSLCASKCNLYERSGACTYAGMGLCYGACVGEESVEDYNVRAIEGKIYLNKVFDDNFVLMLEGRSQGEQAVVLVEDGHYRGYGYISKEDASYGIEELKETIKYVPINPETNKIVRTYLERNSRLKKIRF